MDANQFEALKSLQDLAFDIMKREHCTADEARLRANAAHPELVKRAGLKPSEAGKPSGGRAAQMPVRNPPERETAALERFRHNCPACSSTRITKKYTAGRNCLDVKCQACGYAFGMNCQNSNPAAQ